MAGNTQDPNKDTKQSVQQKTIRQQQLNGSVIDVPYFPAPRHNADESISRLSVQAAKQAREGKDVGIPASATQDALLNAQYVPIPSGGMAALADRLWPQDVDNVDSMDQHVYDLMTMNRDIIRDTSSAQVGTLVRVPKL